jgi:hypothetical protein
MKPWNDKTLRPLLTSIRAALLRGIVNEGTLGEISAMILLLKSMDELKAGLGWRKVHHFIKQLVVMEKTSEKEEIMEKEICAMIPNESKINFNHFIQWFRKFEQSDILLLLRRRAACILQRNQRGADLLITFSHGMVRKSSLKLSLYKSRIACVQVIQYKLSGSCLRHMYFIIGTEKNRTFHFSEWFLNLD